MAWAGANRIYREKSSHKRENEDSMIKILKALDLKKDGKVKVQSFIDIKERNNVNVESNEIGELFSLAKKREIFDKKLGIITKIKKIASDL